MTTSFQNFNLDLDIIERVLKIFSNGISSPIDIASELGMGPRKVRDIFEWSNHLELLCKNPSNSKQSLTTLGQKIIGFNGWTNQQIILDILYTNLVRNHGVINQIVNDLAYNSTLGALSKITINDYRAFLSSLAPTFDAKVDVMLDRSSKFLNALVQPSGFGNLEIFSLAKDKLSFLVRPKVPAWQSAAYILYSTWPTNVSRLRIDELLRERNSLGRIFFLSEMQILSLFSRLEQERIIALEIIADLNQVGLNPSLRANDLWEMISDDQR